MLQVVRHGLSTNRLCIRVLQSVGPRDANSSDCVNRRVLEVQGSVPRLTVPVLQTALTVRTAACKEDRARSETDCPIWLL